MNKKILLSMLCGFFVFTGYMFCEDLVTEDISQIEIGDVFDEFDFDFPEPVQTEKQGMSLMQQILFLIKNPSITWYITKQKTKTLLETTGSHFEENSKLYWTVIGVVGGSVITYFVLNKYGDCLRDWCCIPVEYLP